MNDRWTRPLFYCSVFVAAIATLLASLVGGAYLTVLVAANGQASWQLQLIVVLATGATLGYCFKRTSPWLRLSIALALIFLTIFLMPSHNCGATC